MVYRIFGMLAAVWLGMQLMSGYIAAPVLFKMLPRMLAGEIAGVLFSVLAYIGLVVWGVLCLLEIKHKKRCNYIFSASVTCLLVVHQFVLTPIIQALKYHSEHWLLSAVGGSFAFWHGISAIVFMLIALLACIHTIRVWIFKRH